MPRGGSGPTRSQAAGPSRNTASHESTRARHTPYETALHSLAGALRLVLTTEVNQPALLGQSRKDHARAAEELFNAGLGPGCTKRRTSRVSLRPWTPGRRGLPLPRGGLRGASLSADP